MFRSICLAHHPIYPEAADQKLTRTGLPAHPAALKRGGKSCQLRLAGPFETFAEAKQATLQTRVAGINKAFAPRLL